MDMVAAAAATEAVVLIVGEPGTGKSLLASQLHDLSARSSGPFVRATRDSEEPPTHPAGEGGELHLRSALNHLERQLILEALRRAGGVRRETARLLGIDPRNLGYFMRKHGLGDWTPGSAQDGDRAGRRASRVSPKTVRL
jgi:transcriptional regulator with GAF, ATPase, and Fis domain